MAVDPGRIDQFNQQGGSGAYSPQAQALYRMLGGTNNAGIAKSRGPAGPGLSSHQLQSAFDAYHPKNTKLHDALIKIHNDQTSSKFKTNMDLFKPRPGEPQSTPKIPTLPSPTTPFQPGTPKLPGPFGTTPKTPGVTGSSAAPSQADVTRYTDATKLNQAKAFNEAAAANNTGGGWGTFAHGFLSELGAPVTPDAQAALYTIMMSEQAPDNPNARNNPLNIQAGDFPHEGVSGGGQYNFPSMAEGVKQTAEFLRRNPVYSRIVDAFQRGAPAEEILNEWQASPWAESHYHGQLPSRVGGVRSNMGQYAQGQIRG